MNSQVENVEKEGVRMWYGGTDSLQIENSDNF